MYNFTYTIEPIEKVSFLNRLFNICHQKLKCRVYITVYCNNNYIHIPYYLGEPTEIKQDSVTLVFDKFISPEGISDNFYIKLTNNKLHKELDEFYISMIGHMISGIRYNHPLIDVIYHGHKDYEFDCHHSDTISKIEFRMPKNKFIIPDLDDMLDSIHEYDEYTSVFIIPDEIIPIHIFSERIEVNHDYSYRLGEIIKKFKLKEA